MNTKLLKFTLFAAMASFAATSCSSDDDTSSTSSKPTITSITADSIETTSISATFAFASTEELYYACVEGAADDFSAGSTTFEVVEVSKSDKEITIDFEDLTEATTYTIAAYAINGDMETGVTTTEVTTLSEPEEDDGLPAISLALNSSATAIEVTAKNATQYTYQIYADGSKPAEGAESWVSVNINETTSYSISIESLTTGDYVIEAYATYYDSEEMIETDSDIVTLDFSFEALVDSYFTVADSFTITPTMIAIDLDLDDTYCEGVALTVVETMWYLQSGFTGMITAGTIDYLVESDTKFIANGGSFLIPDTSYTIAAVAIKKVGEYENSWEQIIPIYETRGSVWSKTFTTASLEIGTSDAVVSVKEDTSIESSISLGVTIEQGTDAAGYIVGYTAESNIESDVTSWINDNNWLDSSSMEIVAFEEGVSTASIEITGLASSTPYTVFAIGISEEGYLGDVISTTITTQAVAKNENIAYTAQVVPGIYQSTLEVTFGNECEKIFYYNGAAVSNNYYEDIALTDADAENYLLGYMASGANMLAASAAVDSSASVVFSGLSSETLYYCYTVGVDADGKISAINKIEYTTSALNFDSTAKVTLTLDSVSLDGNSNASTWLNVEMSDGATSFVYPTSGINTTWYTLDSMEDYGIAALKEFFKTTSTAAKININLLNSYYTAVVIPMDKYGNYGTPVIFEVDWSTL